MYSWNLAQRAGSAVVASGPGNRSGGTTQMKASDLFVQCLETEGIEYIFGVPGEETPTS